MMFTKENAHTVLQCFGLLKACTCPKCLHTGLEIAVRDEHKKPFAIYCPGCNVIHEPEILLKEMGELSC